MKKTGHPPRSTTLPGPARTPRPEVGATSLSFDIRASSDDDVCGIGQLDSVEKLSMLLSLLTGETITVPHPDFDPSRRRLLQEVVDGLNRGRGNISLEQLNEILLLLGARRVSRGFFDFFFLGHDSRSDVGRTPAPPTINLPALRAGIARFRVFALLCFGNFAFAFARLSAPPKDAASDSIDSVRGLIGAWAHSPLSRRRALRARPAPLLPIEEASDLVARDHTWLLGYLSVGQVHSEYARAFVLHAKSRRHSKGRALKTLSRLRPPEAVSEIFRHSESLWAGIRSPEVDRYRSLIPELVATAQQLLGDLNATTARATRNTVRYLTWDHLDVYVATSMRERWEFEDTFDAVEAILGPLARSLRVRHFDPTQSFEHSPVDKGLLESLMLKRARCTLYLAQESDSFGKDSELAATLAQGKPVVVFVPDYRDSRLPELKAKILKRPLRYFRKRLLEVLASELLQRDAERVSEQLNQLTGSRTTPERLRAESSRLASSLLLEEAHPVFELLLPAEERAVFERMGGKEYMASLLASIEAISLERRAAMYLGVHPLALQVHLETGVANGVLVARTEREATALVEALLTNTMRFRVGAAEDKTTKRRIGTALFETLTDHDAKFRVVTDHALLTNSFWSFYLRNTS